MGGGEGEGVHEKNNIEGEDSPKKGSWTVWIFKGGAWQERGVFFARGVDTSMHTIRFIGLLSHQMLC